MDNQLNSEALSRITTEIFYTNGLLLAWGDRFAADLGLTSARWQMLGALAHAAEAQTSPQLGERMGMSRQGAQKQLNLLLADGLVAAADNPAAAVALMAAEPSLIKRPVLEHGGAFHCGFQTALYEELFAPLLSDGCNPPSAG